MEAPETLIARLHGPDQPGIVARASRWIFERGGNILNADQHRDPTTESFLQRLEWEHPEADLAAEAAAFRAFAEGELGMEVHTQLSSHRPRVAVMVSRIPHCFQDFVLRWHGGTMPCEIACVVSNHKDLRSFAKSFGLPFHYLPIDGTAKEIGEAEQLEALAQYDVELIVLARYMQVLSPEFLARCGCPVINIHHSFLPAFAGGRPYHQAHARGVKLIGATAHYATADLDEGPIIVQDVTTISHRHGVADLIRRGSDLEKSVLARAVRYHLDSRVIAFGNKTVVFD